MFDWRQLLEPVPLGIMALGTALGIIWGAMPGLTTTMAMILLITLTWKMPTWMAVAFLCAVFPASVFGGAITGVLMNMPGTPASIPTQLAGYPLTLKGRGGEALGLAVVGSVLGNWIGILVLMVAAPRVLKFALAFGPWELFLLGVWATILAGSMSFGGNTPLKGWIAGCLGMLVAMVGRDPILGVERFTFGSVELGNGIDYVPLLIGLFGLYEAVRVLSVEMPSTSPGKVGRIIPSLGLAVRYWKSAIRSGLLGTLIGVLPGAGPDMAAFLAYRVAERSAGRDFSKGDYEGVLSSEVANNAQVGGSLLPTMTLGVPGSAGAAAFMAALGLHGIVVGPTIERDHPEVLSYVYAALLIGNVLMYALALVLIRPSVKLFGLPPGSLMPMVVVLCVVGAYAVKVSGFDVAIMVLFGLIGFLMHYFGLPTATFILGVILGPLVDTNLRTAMLVFQHRSVYEILTRPVGTTLVVLILLTLLEPLFRRRMAIRFGLARPRLS